MLIISGLIPTIRTGKLLEEIGIDSILIMDPVAILAMPEAA